MNMSKYQRLTKTVNAKGILVKPEDLHKHIKNQEQDYYLSTYYYKDEHLPIFNEKVWDDKYNKWTIKGGKGITDVTTNKIWFDFDSEDDTSLARKDAITLIERFSQVIDTKALEIYFSGNKGYNVILNTTKELNRKQVEAIAKKFGNGLKTFDPSMYDEPQLLRVPGTKHQKSGLYKIPLTFEELKSLPKSQILEKAAKRLSLEEAISKTLNIDIDDSWLEIKEVEAEVKAQSLKDFDLTSKPRQWKASKWALMQGFFKGGERDSSMMILASTLKAQGFDETQTYSLCKDALKKSWERYGEGNFTREDLWAKIERIFSAEWKGGTYSEKEDLFLQQKAEELGIKELITADSVDIKGALRLYKDYARNINKLTLKTGIEEIDSRQRITVGMSFGIIAAPGVGKTSLALQMLHSMSKSGEFCIFFSYDMYAPLIVQKIIQKHWENDNQINEVFKKYEDGDEEYVNKVEKLIVEEYPNVEFCFETAQTIDDIYRTIRDAEQKHGKKCKFIVIDYNELVITDVSDPTQSSNFVAQKVRELASREQVCVLSLFQPNKMSGDPSSEITSYRSAKGGSGIEQSVSLMFGVSRPGFDPRKPAQDKFISINCVKNRMGPIFSVDLHWNGYKGEIRSLNPQEARELEMMRREKEEEKNEDETW